MSRLTGRIASYPLRQPLVCAVIVYWVSLCVATHWPVYGHMGLPVYNDKLAHFGSYALLSFLLAANLNRMGLSLWRIAMWTILIATLYGAVDELTQLPIPGRTGDVMDWLADCVGALTGSLLFSGLAVLCPALVRRSTSLERGPQ